MSRRDTVRVWTEDVVIPTYPPAAPDPNPMFLEKRVYQGSSGKVYPLPFIDRIGESKVDRAWKAIWLENEYLRVMVLPELGGRIHVAEDKTNGYDFIYRQSVIKPALVGLAGPWISGGIEFNWPQHHRPSTFLPVDVRIEEYADGSKTVWLSEHDPMARMKGMHGVTLYPGRAVLEVKARVYNRTPLTQTFLWWANVAARVHEAYQSFFPRDTTHVADHAKRATSDFPRSRGVYYGVDYGTRGRRGVPRGEEPTHFRPPQLQGRGPKGGRSRGSGTEHPCPSYTPDDLSWYANIPVPTSYMCMGSKQDFFGGYDHARGAGFVHVASHHVSPGKKQWTWGNHEFGYAWDRNLSDDGGPYIELMAGVYTDNQPDFSFLSPWETKTWSQSWYPIQAVGPAHEANTEAAVHVSRAGSKLRFGVAVTRSRPRTRIRIEAGGRVLREWTRDLAPDRPFVGTWGLARRDLRSKDLLFRVIGQGGREIIAGAFEAPARGEAQAPATEPPSPEETESADALYTTGLHLEQYRHATRSPADWWREAIRRDPLDSRSNEALGLWHLRRGEFAAAEPHFRRAIARLTSRNPNPLEGGSYYHLGLALRYRLDGLRGHAVEAAGMSEDAEAAFHKAAWSRAWRGPARRALAEMACRRSRLEEALEHLDLAIRADADDLGARDLKAAVLRRLGRTSEAEEILRGTIALDPLDAWALELLGEPVPGGTETRIDVAIDCARAGLHAEALEALSKARPETGSGTEPRVACLRAWIEERAGKLREAKASRRAAERAPSDYCFPSRLEEMTALESALRANPGDARAARYLGNLLYDRRRHEEAIRLWEESARLEPESSVVWRNLGIGYFNIHRSPAKARRAYERAVLANPGDARLVFERDQLWKRLGVTPSRRLRELLRRPELVARRDDLSVELCALLNSSGRPEEALRVLASRRFQPWEGGEGLVIAEYARAHLLLGRRALLRGEPETARAHFEAALQVPENLGEARHLLANASDVRYRLGEACAASGDAASAKRHWKTAATFRGDFQEMSIRSYSEMTLWSALAWERLGRPDRMREILQGLLAHSKALRGSEAGIDYFATSLPAMLLFEDDLARRQETTAIFLEAQARFALGEKTRARQLLEEVLRRDPAHGPATDLLEVPPCGPRRTSRASARGPERNGKKARPLSPP